VKLDPHTRALLEAERFEAVEDLWLAHVEEAPEDLEFFLPVLRGLLQHKATERAELLLQLLLDAHRERSGTEPELATLGRIVAIWPESAPVRAAIVDCLRRRHPASANLERLLTHFGLADGKEPEKSLTQVESWLRFDIGQAVHSPAHGTGRVREINLGLATVRADFRGQIISFRLGEAERLLTPLAAGHFLLEKLEHLADLQRVAHEDPGEILHRAFASLGSPLALADLRNALDGVVPAEEWTAWWKRARADARLTVGPGTRPQCSWSETAAAAADQVAAEFAGAAPRAQIEIARKHSGRSPELARTLVRGLVALVHAARDADPALALEALDALESLPLPEPEPVPVDAEAILQREDVATILAGVGDRRARERAIDLLPKIRPDWPRAYAAILMNETDTRTLARVYQALRDGPEPEALERTIQETLTQPSRAPRLFLWLCREMPSRPELESRADWRFLRRLFEACGTDSLKGQRAALRELFDTGGIALRVVERLDRDQAEQFLAFLERGAVLEEHRKNDLRQAIWTLHPDLKQPEEEPIYVTAAALERKRAEFDQITRVDLPRNTEEIRRAAAHGDLRENFEYKAARERQEMLSSRAKSMHDELRRARVLDPADIDPSAIRVGTRVQLVPAADGGTPLALTILGPWDSEPSRGVLSYMAPAVARILGKSVGERVVFGEAEFTVGAIEVWQR
jgi:transcription elongation GreA/GreB family factor